VCTIHLVDFDQNLISLGLVWYVAFLFSLTVHEAAHALAALKLGDPTAYQGGQVSLNPLPHIKREPFGTVLVPLLSFAFAGWMMGWASAPYNPTWAERYPRRAAWMALAGPASNLLLVLLAGIGIRIGILMGALQVPSSVGFTSVVEATGAGPAVGLATFLSILFTLNLLLCLFNLIPLPPLDGSGALALVLSPSAAAQWKAFMRQPMMGMVGLIIAWRLIGYLFSPTFLLAIRALYPELSFG
jgi:Zn-dependent protease